MLAGVIIAGICIDALLVEFKFYVHNNLNSDAADVFQVRLRVDEV